MTPAGPNPPDSGNEDSRDERLGELINDFFDRRQRGDPISAEQFLAEHPQDADALREHLSGLELLDRIGSSGDRTRAQPVAIRQRGSSSDDPFRQGVGPPPSIPGYEVYKQIGRGGMGVVYKALQISTKRVVALKLLMEGPLASESSRRRFEREIALSAQLRHPNIIPIYDSGQADGRMFYAMEFVFGLPLGDYLRIHELPQRAALELFVRVCRPVGHAHQRGIIHRDLKPSNILVDGDGDPHVLDFGLAKAGSLGDTQASVTAQIVGTPAYMSPEQASGDTGGVDTRVDVYALGVMLYESLTGQMPYDTTAPMGKVLHNIAHAEPTPPRRLNSKIDSDLEAIVLKALEKRKEDRYQSVDALTTDLTRFLNGEPISVKPASGLYLLRKAVWKHRQFVAVMGIAAAFVVAVLGIILHFSSRIQQSEQQVAEKQARVEQLEREATQQAPPPFDPMTTTTGFEGQTTEMLAVLVSSMGRQIDSHEARVAQLRAAGGDNDEIRDEQQRLTEVKEQQSLASFELARRSLPPETVAMMDALASRVGSGLRRPEAAVAGGIGVLADIVGEIGAGEDDTQSFKRPDLDFLLEESSKSGRPPDLADPNVPPLPPTERQTPQGPARLGEEFGRLAEQLIRAGWQPPPTTPPAASQPSSSQPAATQPAASQPAASQPAPKADAASHDPA